MNSRVSESPRFSVSNPATGLGLAGELVLAGSSEERRKGLLARQGLSANSGLWINPCEAIHTFGMQFPIDVVFLDARYRVVKMRESMPARRICVCWRATSVLELPVGTIAASRTQPGQTLAIERCSPQTDPPVENFREISAL